MAKKNQSDSIQRRDFLRQSACSSLGISGVVNTLAHLRLTNAALAADAPIGGDYKALVVLFLYGGNDAHNTLVPMGNHPARPDYESARGILALPESSLSPLNFPAPTDRQYGLHPAMAPLQSDFNDGDLAFVANVGTLAFPVTRQEYLDGSVPLPPRLFSHSDQQEQWMSSVPDKPFQNGWGGRAAELLNASYNSNSEVSMSISLGGINSFQFGTAGGVDQYVVSPSGAIALDGFGSNYSGAIDANGEYILNYTGRRLRAFDQGQLGAHANLLAELGGALGAFDATMKALGAHDEVMTMTHSDFTRTLTPNGSLADSSGSDHAWGGHHLVMGGAVKGGQVYGTFPELRVGGANDTNGDRGRLIPTTSVEQYSSVPARWLGVQSSALENIFPNLSRFDDPFSVASANLDFVDLTV